MQNKLKCKSGEFWHIFLASTLSLIHKSTGIYLKSVIVHIHMIVKNYIILWRVDPRQQLDTPTATCSLLYLLQQNRGLNRVRESRKACGTKKVVYNVGKMVDGFAKAKPFPQADGCPSQSLNNGHTGRQNPNPPYPDLLLDVILDGMEYSSQQFAPHSSSFPSPKPLWVGFAISQRSFSFVFWPTHEHHDLFLLGLRKNIRLVYSLLIIPPKACVRSTRWSIWSSVSASAHW